MEEVLVWVMRDADGTRLILGSFGEKGVIYRRDHAPSGKVYRETHRARWPEQAVHDVCTATQQAEDSFELVVEPMVLEVRSPPAAGSHLYDWVDEVIVPRVEERMRWLELEKVRRKIVSGL